MGVLSVTKWLILRVVRNVNTLGLPHSNLIVAVNFDKKKW